MAPDFRLCTLLLSICAAPALLASAAAAGPAQEIQECRQASLFRSVNKPKEAAEMQKRCDDKLRIAPPPAGASAAASRQERINQLRAEAVARQQAAMQAQMAQQRVLSQQAAQQAAQQQWMQQRALQEQRAREARQTPAAPYPAFQQQGGPVPAAASRPAAPAGGRSLFNFSWNPFDRRSAPGAQPVAPPAPRPPAAPAPAVAPSPAPAAAPAPSVARRPEQPAPPPPPGFASPTAGPPDLSIDQDRVAARDAQVDLGVLGLNLGAPLDLLACSGSDGSASASRANDACVLRDSAGGLLVLAAMHWRGSRQVPGLIDVPVRLPPERCPDWLAAGQAGCAAVFTTKNGYAVSVYLPVDGESSRKAIEGALIEKYKRPPAPVAAGDCRRGELGAAAKKTKVREWVLPGLRVSYDPTCPQGNATDAGLVRISLDGYARALAVGAATTSGASPKL